MAAGRNPSFSGRGRLLLVALVGLAACHAGGAPPRPNGTGSASEDPGRRSRSLQTPGVDTMTPLPEVVRRIHECKLGPGPPGNGGRLHRPAGASAGGREPAKGDEPADRAIVPSCAGVLYVWSPLMPLSRMGVGDIAEATDSLGLRLTVMGARSLYEHLDATEVASDPIDAAPASAVHASPSREMATGPAALRSTHSLVRGMLAAGATVHYPAVLLYDRTGLHPKAILGYRTAEAYRDMIGRRLGNAGPGATSGAGSRAVGVQHSPPPGPPGLTAAMVSSGGGPWRDVTARGRPGAYFRWVPGTDLLVYAAARRVYFLDLESGENRVGPGYIDFVPTPDGRLFVTPARNRAGLEFYHARVVLEAVRNGTGGDIAPFYIDPEMQDQYPSAGILVSTESAEEGTTRYRILTSWYDRVVYRDYDVQWDRRLRGRETPVVRPVRPPVPACQGREISLPIMAKDGQLLAGRDEETATTKLYRIRKDGICEEVLDLKLPTGKVAFDAVGRRVAFAVPSGAIRDGRGRRYAGVRGTRATARELAGIFVLDRETLRTTRVRGSEAVDRLAFPEFVGRDTVVFMLAPTGRGEPSRFRVVCCVR